MPQRSSKLEKRLAGIVGGPPPRTPEELAAWVRWNRATKVLGDKLVTEGLTREDYPGTDEGWERLLAFDALIDTLRKAEPAPEPAPELPDMRRVPGWAWRSVMTLDENDATVAACAWVAAWHTDQPPVKGLLVAGPTGVGKTSIAAAIAYDCDPAAYWPMRELARRAREDVMGAGGFVATLIVRPLLVLDDVGVERTDFQRDVLREVIEGRADRDGRMVVTTNLKLAQLRSHLGDRCWSRLHAMCVWLPVAGRDRRLPT